MSKSKKWAWYNRRMNSSPQADQDNELEGTDIYGTEMLELESYEQGEDFCDYDGMDDSDSE